MKSRLQAAITDAVRPAKALRTCPCPRFFVFSARPQVLRRSKVVSPLKQYGIALKCVNFFGASVFVAGALAASINIAPVVHAEAPPRGGDSQTRKIRLEEVEKHGRNAETKWITKGTRVYDITDWIPGHPGGEVILQAVGSSVDQYWNIFTIHNKQEVYDILEEYYIGDVDPQDLVNDQVPAETTKDPFKNDPKRDDRLLVHSERPCNAETPTEELSTFLTPNETFYVRNHLWVPGVDAMKHKLTVELYDGEEREYTLKDLKEKFKQVTITATLQCSGNRRKHMSQESRSTNGLQWNVGGLSNAEWTGVRLRDVLADAGFSVDELPDDVKHAQFTGAEAYGASIPIEKAVDRWGDVLLAYEMNGEPLPADHGYPLRLIIPGNVAARSVKWVNKIVVSDEESTSQWQRRDYKCFGPNCGGKPDWDSAPAIQEMPVQSAITSLRDISSHSIKDSNLLQVYGLEQDCVAVEGYALSGGGRKIVRVDVSADGGRSWHQAEILQDERKGSRAWAWTRWRWVIPKHQAGRSFVVKAVDEAYNTQPESYDANWNFRGNLTSAWHRVGYGPERT
ncbi:hypothetical protein MMC28_009406 [Mycoblastus sanguinarius]|nr:hypothetical protein [Mycoblastus sanguinarius]